MNTRCLGWRAVLELCAVLQTTPSGSSTLRFTNLLSRLLDQVSRACLYEFRLLTTCPKPVLSRKHASLQFLYTLASTPTSAPAASFLPALAPPPPTRPSSKATTPIDSQPPHRTQRGKSKADLLREYRLRLGSSPSKLPWFVRFTLHRSTTYTRTPHPARYPVPPARNIWEIRTVLRD